MRWRCAALLMMCSLGNALAAEPTVFAHPAKAEELAANLLAETAHQLQGARVLRGEFKHRKFLADIPAPLESSGEFVFIRDEGLYWHTQKPFDSVFVLTPRGIVQKDEGGREIRTDADAQPAVRAAATIFLSLFGLDLAALDKDFRLFGQASGKGGWLLGLKPKSTAMSSVFSQALIQGAAQVQQVELNDAYGDRTLIELRNTQLLTRAPTAQELKLLGR